MSRPWRREPHWVSNPHPDFEDDPPSEDDTLTQLQRYAQPFRLHILDAIHAAFPALLYPVSRPHRADRCPGAALMLSAAEAGAAAGADADGGARGVVVLRVGDGVEGGG